MYVTFQRTTKNIFTFNLFIITLIQCLQYSYFSSYLTPEKLKVLNAANLAFSTAYDDR